jgi:hypothetical protein
LSAAEPPLQTTSTLINSRLSDVTLLTMQRTLRETNAQLLLLLAFCALERDPRLALARALRAKLNASSATTLAKLTALPVLLVDAGFTDHTRWSAIAERINQSHPESAGSLWAPRSEATTLARSTLLYVWQLFRLDLRTGIALVGANRACAEAIAALSVGEVLFIAEHYPHWFQPRWCDRPQIWKRLIQLCERDEWLRDPALYAIEIFLGAR